MDLAFYNWDCISILTQIPATLHFDSVLVMDLWRFTKKKENYLQNRKR